MLDLRDLQLRKLRLSQDHGPQHMTQITQIEDMLILGVLKIRVRYALHHTVQEIK